MPTPRATDGTKGGPNQRGSKGDRMLPSTVMHLPTPRASDHNAPGLHGNGGQDLRTVVSLLPTPLQRDHHGLPADGYSHSSLPRTVSLLPTPAVNDMGAGKDPEEFDEWAARQKAADGRHAPHGRSLSVEVLREVRGPASGVAENDDEDTLFKFLPTPTASDYKGSTAKRQQPGCHRGQLDGLIEGTALDGTWGEFGPAVERWERLTRVVPPAVDTSPRGRRGLSPKFVEWMMGLPEGWVTDPALGLTRKEQLRALGNGVVPQQAAAATQLFLRDYAQYGNA